MTKSIQFGAERQLAYHIDVHPAGDFIRDRWVGDEALRNRIRSRMAPIEGSLWMEHFMAATGAAENLGIPWVGPFSSEREMEFDRVT